MLKTSAARAALAVAALLVVPACSKEGTAHFEITRTYNIPTGTTWSSPVTAVDLSTEAAEAWGHRDKVQELRVTNVTVVASNVTAPAGTTGSGSFLVKPATGADVTAGTFTGVNIANGTWLNTGGNPALDDAIEAALKGDGQLSFVASATAQNAFSATVRVTVIGEVDYKISAGL